MFKEFFFSLHERFTDTHTDPWNMPNLSDGSRKIVLKWNPSKQHREVEECLMPVRTTESDRAGEEGDERRDTI